MILPPPNITGTLHLGHALTVTVQDTLARWYRMKGFDVAWVPGSDHAGIGRRKILKTCVEMERGKRKHNFGTATKARSVARLGSILFYSERLSLIRGEYSLQNFV